jgi:hypothetical protein
VTGLGSGETRIAAILMDAGLMMIASLQIQIWAGLPGADAGDRLQGA